MSPLDVIKQVRFRTGVFNVYDSCDRIELLELHNRKLKHKIREIREESFHIDEKVDYEKDRIDELKNEINMLSK